MPTSSAITTPRITNHSVGSTCPWRSSACPASAVMIGEAITNASTPAASVRSAENCSPSSRRTPNANSSTVSTVNRTISGMASAVMAGQPNEGGSLC